MKRVLFIAFDFPPIGGAGVHRSLKFAKYLPSFGWIPTILTVDPEYKKNVVRDEILLKQLSTDTKIIRIKFPDNLNRKIINKSGFIYSILRSYCCVWPDIFKPWIKNCVSAGMEEAVGEKYDLLFATIFPTTAGLSGVILSKKLNIPLISDFRDTISTTTFYDFPTKLHWHIAKHYEKLIISNSFKTVMNTKVAKAEMAVQYPKYENRITYIPNGFDEEDFKNISWCDTKEKIRIVYMGSYLNGQSTSNYNNSGFPKNFKEFKAKLKYSNRPMNRTTMSMEAFFDALTLLKSRSKHVYDKVEVLFIGGRKNQTDKEINERALQDSVKHIGYLSHRKALSYLLSANALLLTHLMPLDSHPISSVPSKCYEYIRSYRPILALLPKGDAYEIVENSNLGIFISQTDSHEIATKIEHFVNNINKYKLSANKEYINYFNRQDLTKKLVSIFNQASKY